MKLLSGLFLLLMGGMAAAQTSTPHIIIITTDGLRWQEVFKGMDSAIANNSRFNEGDSAYIYKNYWSDDESERRRKLFPFLWGTVVQKGQLYGNRDKESKVDNANPYWFSYPGYSELFTGFADTAINSNSHPPNPHVTVLEFLNRQPALKGKVAAFGAWDAFDRILNEERSGIPVICAFDATGGRKPTPNEIMINRLLKDSYKPWKEHECLDVFTHHAAAEWLKTRRPRVLYIAYGETDEWAHAGMYRSYLDAAHQVDRWIKELWDWVQSDPQYRNRTSLLITVDHGRGDLNKEEWTSHGSKIQGAGETWFAILAPTVSTRGEVREGKQLHQEQLAQTIARLMGYKYEATHPVAAEVPGVFSNKK